MITNFIIWNVKPQIVDLGSLPGTEIIIEKIEDIILSINELILE